MPRGREMLAEQVLAVVVAVRRAHDDVDVLAAGLAGIGGEMPQVGRPLVVELDQHHRAVYPIVEHAIVAIPADPREMRAVEVSPHLLEFHPRVAVGHVAGVQGDQFQQRRALPGVERRRRYSSAPSR